MYLSEDQDAQDTEAMIKAEGKQCGLVFNPAAPVEVGYYDTPGEAIGIQVVGTLAYVADGSSGLRIINVSNPSAPVEIGYYGKEGFDDHFSAKPGIGTARFK